MQVLEKKLPIDITLAELKEVDYRFRYSEEEMFSDWDRLKKLSLKQMKYGSQFKPGLKISQHFCDNFFELKSRNGKSFVDSWNNPIIMQKVVDWGREKMSALYLSWIRRAVYMASGLHNPNHYRPHFTKKICLTHSKTKGILFDPCAGWGGRLLGTVSAGWDYIGVEPNKQTYDNLLRIVDFLDIQKHVTLYNSAYEDMDLSILPTIDIVLTSPPYFNLEKYDDTDKQSYIRFDNYDEWLNDWFLSMVSKNLMLLDSDGFSCYNVQNSKDTPLIVEKTADTHNEFGYNCIDSFGINTPFKNYKKQISSVDLTYVFSK